MPGVAVWVVVTVALARPGALSLGRLESGLHTPRVRPLSQPQHLLSTIGAPRYPRGAPAFWRCAGAPMV
jgi:hypothetical protein